MFSLYIDSTIDYIVIYENLQKEILSFGKRVANKNKISFVDIF